MHPEAGGNFDTHVPVDSAQPPQPRAQDTPNARAAALQRKLELNRFLDMHAGIDQPFSAGDLAEAMDGPNFDEAWAEATLEKLADVDRVHRALSGQGWHSRPRSE
jgi:hypothetical protein